MQHTKEKIWLTAIIILFIAIWGTTQYYHKTNPQEQETCNGRNCIDYSQFDPETGDIIKAETINKP